MNDDVWFLLHSKKKKQKDQRGQMNCNEEKYLFWLLEELFHFFCHSRGDAAFGVGVVGRVDLGQELRIHLNGLLWFDWVSHEGQHKCVHRRYDVLYFLLLLLFVKKKGEKGGSVGSSWEKKKKKIWFDCAPRPFEGFLMLLVADCVRAANCLQKEESIADIDSGSSAMPAIPTAKKNSNALSERRRERKGRKRRKK
jgi:hypothetical protein